jgi:uncharacterized protein (UPF0276 family)
VIPVGFTLQPEEAFLDLLAGVIDEADYYEVAPETLWRCDGGGALVPNGFFRRFEALAARGDKRFVAHGVGLSIATSAEADVARQGRWLERIAQDHRTFRFAWYTDHLGASAPAGLAAALPLPLPATAEAAEVVRASLDRLGAIVGDVGVENTVHYFTLGDPLDEPRLLGEILRAPRRHLVLDLHNLFTMGQNFGFDPAEYLARLDLAKVIEIHVSGGSYSDAGWLPSRRVLRLDSHDARVPEEVWDLLDRVAPRCPRLRGVTLERMEGTVTDDDVPRLLDELRRARGAVRRLGGAA